MGFLSWLLGEDLTAASVTIPPSQGDVAKVANLPTSVAEAFGINLNSSTVNRTEAIGIPSVSKGRAVIAGTLGTIPLICTRTRAGNAPERVERTFLTQPDPDVTRTYHLTWTIDDLVFYGVSWWLVTERDSSNFPSHAKRILPGHLTFDQLTGKPLIDSAPVNPRDIIRFDGPDEGLLKRGARALRTSIMLEEAVRKYATMDIPLGMLADQEGMLTQDEVDKLLNSWESARARRSTAYLPRGLEYKNPTFDAEQLQLSEARNHQAAEIARLMNLPPDAVNAPSNDSLTYSTTEANRRQLVDMTFKPYINAIEQRLSMGDVTPNGTTVHLDLAEFLRGDLTTVLNAAKIGIDAGILTVDEVRTDWLKLPPKNEG